MPAYNTLSPPPALFSMTPNQSVLVFNKEALTEGEYSQQVNLPPGPVGTPKAVLIVMDFSANPGNVAINPYGSDNDAAGTAGYWDTGNDQTQSALISGPNGPSTRLVWDIVPFDEPFLSLYVATNPSNSGITATARVSRAN